MSAPEGSAPPPPAVGEPTDEEVLTAVARGETEALGRLYDRYHQLAMAVAYRVLGDRGAAEDAVHDGFLAAWRRVDSFDPTRGTVRVWLLAIVRNAAIDRRRGRHARMLADTPLDDVAYRLSTSTEETLTMVEASVEAARVRDALAQLPAAQRQAIELAYFGGLTHQEIAERTGAPLGTIKGRMRLGLHKLRASLADLLPSAPPDAPFPGDERGVPTGDESGLTPSAVGPGSPPAPLRRPAEPRTLLVGAA